MSDVSEGLERTNLIESPQPNRFFANRDKGSAVFQKDQFIFKLKEEFKKQIQRKESFRSFKNVFKSKKVLVKK